MQWSEEKVSEQWIKMSNRYYNPNVVSSISVGFKVAVYLMPGTDTQHHDVHEYEYDAVADDLTRLGIVVPDTVKNGEAC